VLRGLRNRLGVDTPVLEESSPDSAHGALVRAGELLEGAAGIKGRQELAVFVFRPRLTGLRGHLGPPTLEALLSLEGGGRFVERPNHLRALVAAFGREDFPGLRIDSVGERTNDS